MGVGNCIGVRNHKTFVAFLVFAGISASLLTLLSLMDAILIFHEAMTTGVLQDDRWAKALAIAAGVGFIMTLIPFFILRASHSNSMGFCYFGSAVIAVVWVYFLVNVKPAPWQPLCMFLLAGPVWGILASAGYEQLRLLGRGLNMKQASRGQNEQGKRPKGKQPF